MQNVDNRLIIDYLNVVLQYRTIKQFLIEKNDFIEINTFLDNNGYRICDVDIDVYDIKKDDIVFTIVNIKDKWLLDMWVDFITYDCSNINTTIEEIEKTLMKLLDKQ